MAQRTITDQEAATTYCSLMAEVKGRLAVLHAVHSKTYNLGNDLARMEFCGLLIRKSLEQIAIASLVSNREAFCAAYDRFETCWNAKLILADIERVNPKFYPRPLETFNSPEPPTRFHLKEIKDGFLTRDNFVDVYEKVASLLHASNPCGRKPDLAFFDERIPTWGSQIARLLEKHLFVLAGSSSVYYVQMHEDDGRVHHYTLSAATQADLESAARR